MLEQNVCPSRGLRFCYNVFTEPRVRKCWISFEIEVKITILQISEREVLLNFSVSDFEAVNYIWWFDSGINLDF